MEELSKDVGVVGLDDDMGGSSSGQGGNSVSHPGNREGYLDGLIREKDALGHGGGMDLTRRLVTQEIERLQSGSRMYGRDDRRMADVTKDKAIKLTIRVLVPVRDHPKFNFVGKLLGPKGNSLKRLQEETITKMAILGRGSMRDKQKEEELRKSGDPKFNHLSEDLHVEVTAVAPPAEAHARIAYALTEIRRYLVPDYNDEIRQEQMREMQLLVGTDAGQAANNGTDNVVDNNNGTANGSDEGSCSPQTNGSPPPHGIAKGGIRAAQITLASPHPALRGLNRTQTALLNSGKNEVAMSRGGSAATAAGGGGSRRSVLSLLTRARALQQKELELMDIYHDLPGYGMYDHLTELAIPEGIDDVAGRGTGGALKVSSPGDRARFRHDPYPRVPSST